MRFRAVKIVLGILLLLVLGALNPAMGQELLIHGLSSHRHGDQQEYNNYNLGLGIRTDTGLVAGGYYNSYKRLTVYVGQEWMPTRNVGAFAALATGYDQAAGRPVTIIGGLLFRARLEGTASLDVRYLPRIKDNPEVVHIGLGIPF